MLTGLYITLRFGHFISLMLAFGCVLYGALVGAGTAETRADAALLSTTAPAAADRRDLYAGAVSPAGRNNGRGLDGCLATRRLAGGGRTRFGGVWIWQILLTWIALAVVWIRPRHGARQLVAPAGGTAAAFRGRARRYARWSHRRAAADKPRCASLLRRQLVWRSVALYLLPAPSAQGRWRPAAVYTMARFSRYGHLAVAGTIASGALNALLIQGGLIGASPWGRMLLIKCALVAGMVVIALVNRYVLVPRMSASGSRAESLILRTTQAEIGLGALALLAVSLFATGNLIELTGKIMKKIVLTMLLLASSGAALAAPQIITVSRFEVGKESWAFNREEVMLTCRPGNALYAINPSTLVQYPLNEVAEQQVKAGKTTAQPISVIQIDDPQHPGQK